MAVDQIIRDALLSYLVIESVIWSFFADEASVIVDSLNNKNETFVLVLVILYTWLILKGPTERFLIWLWEGEPFFASRFTIQGASEVDFDDEDLMATCKQRKSITYPVHQMIFHSLYGFTIILLYLVFKIGLSFLKQAVAVMNFGAIQSISMIVSVVFLTVTAFIILLRMNVINV